METRCLLAAGDLDLAFDTDGYRIDDVSVLVNPAFVFRAEAANDVAVQSDGKIVAVGVAETADPDAFGINHKQFIVTRYLPGNGALDPDFGTGGVAHFSPTNTLDFTAEAVAVQPDGNIVVVGGSNKLGSTGATMMIARLTTTGDLDTTFGTDFDGDGTRDGMRYFSTTVTIAPPVDPTDPGIGNDYAFDVTVHNGRILVAGGSINRSTGSNELSVAALSLADGELDATFNPVAGPGSGTGFTTVPNSTFFGIQANSIAVDSLGRILLGGQVGEVGLGFALARLTADGEIDHSFGTDFDGDGTPDGLVTIDSHLGSIQLKSIQDMAIAADGSVLVTGNAIGAGGVAVFVVAKFGNDGTLDPAFGNGGALGGAGVFATAIPFHLAGFGEGSFGSAITVHANGKILVAGTLIGYEPDPTSPPDGIFQYYAWGAVRISATGVLDPGFGTGGTAVYDVPPAGDPFVKERLNAMTLQADGNILLAGASDGFRLGDFALARVNGSSEVVVNLPPTNVSVTPASVLENKPVGTLVGILDTVDPNAGDSHTYALVTEAGVANDNSQFAIVGNELRTTAVFDFEIKSSYSIRVKTTDQDGLALEKTLAVTVLDVDESTPQVVNTGFRSSGLLPASAETLTVQFSKPVIGATLPPNYTLQRAGADGLLGTADDPVISITSATYADNTATLFFPSLSQDVYRLTVLKSITDTFGLPLGADPTKPAGVDWRGDFVVNVDTMIDASFGVGGVVTTEYFADPANPYDNANTLLVQPDGKTLAVSGNTILRFHLNGILDASFGFQGRATLPGAGIADAKLQSDGKIVVVGTATVGVNLSEFAVARFNTDGSLDSSFGGRGWGTIAVGTMGNDQATSVAVQADGRIVVGGFILSGSAGAFLDFDFALARFNSDGSLDTSFGTDGKVITDFGGSQDQITSLVVQADGKIVAIGSRGTIGNTIIAMARYKADGTLDNSFDGDGKTTTDYDNFTRSIFPKAAAISGDGKVVVAAQTNFGNDPTTVIALLRYKDDGSLDTSFGTGGIAANKLEVISGGAGYTNTLADMVVDQNGRFIVTGQRSIGGVFSQAFVARFKSDGTFDPDFDTDGQVYFRFNDVNSLHVGGAARVAVGPNGSIMVGGRDNLLSPPSNNVVDSSVALARLTPAGSLDTTFDGNGIALVDTGVSVDVASRLVVQPDGKLVVAGVTAFGTQAREIALTRYNGDGTLDRSFGVDGRARTPAVVSPFVSDIVIDSDGRIIIAGVSVYERNGVPLSDMFVARYNSDGLLDSGFGVDGIRLIDLSPSESLSSVALLPDGRIVVAGGIAIGDASDFSVLRLTVNGTVDTSFGINGIATTNFQANDVAKKIRVQSDGKLLVVGESSPRGAMAERTFAMAMYLPDGAPDASFGNGGKKLSTSIGAARIEDVAFQDDGKIVIVSAGLRDGLRDAFTVRRFGLDGLPDDTFDGDGLQSTFIGAFTDKARAVTLQSDGKIVVAGESSKQLVLSGESPDEVAVVRYMSDGSIDTTFGVNGIFTTRIGTFNDFVADVAIQVDGSIVVVGGSNTDIALTRIYPGQPAKSLTTSKLGFLFDVDTNGLGNGQFMQGKDNSFDGYSRLIVGDTHFAPTGAATFLNSGQTVRTASANIDGLTVHREVTVPSASVNDFSRTIDVFQNDTPTAIARTVKIVGNLGSDASTTVFKTMNADGTFDETVDATDQWIGTDDADGSGTPAIVHYIHGPKGIVPTAAQVIGDNILWTYSITVDPGQTVRLAHFTILADARAAAIAAAGAIVMPTGVGDQAGAFLSAQEVNSIANFELNNRPVAEDDYYLVLEDTSRELHEGGVPFWGNDIDPDGDYPLSIEIVSGPAFGHLEPPGTALNPGEFYLYTPGLNFFGADPFTYRAIDARGAASNIATVTLEVLAENDPPIEFDVLENTTEDVVDLRTLLPAGVPVTFQFDPTGLGGPEGSESFEIVDGKLRFKSPPDFEMPHGLHDTNTYHLAIRMVHGLSTKVQQILVHVLDVNETPSPVVSFTSDVQQVAEDVGQVTITVNLSVPSVSPVTVPFTIAGTATLAALGAPNDFSTTPSPITIPAGETSAVIVVTVNDDLDLEPTETVILGLGNPIGATLGAISTHTVRITDNDRVAGRTTAEDTPLVLGALPLPLSVPASNTNVRVTLSVLHGTLKDGERSFTQSSGFALMVINLLNGIAIYTPDPNFHGEDTLTFVAENLDDAAAEPASYTVPITVTPVNDAPIANDAGIFGRENLSVSELLTGFDVDGDSLTYTLLTGPGNSPTHGKVVLDVIGGAAFTYTPNVDFVGSDTFRFRVADGNGLTSEATVTVTIQATIAPIAGRVVFDVNGNGIADPTEPGIANIEVTLSATDVTFVPLTQRTNEYGEFDFRGLLPRNDYRLSAAQPVLTTSTPGAPENFQFAMAVTNPQPPVVPRDFAEREITDAAAINDEVARWASDPLIPGLIFAHSGANADWWAFGEGWAGYKSLSMTIATDGATITFSAQRITKSDDVSVEQVISVIGNPNVVLRRFTNNQFVVNLRGTAEDFGLPKASLPGWAVLGSKADDVLTVDYASGLFWLNNGAKKRLSGIETIFFDGGTGNGKNTVAIRGTPEIDIFYKPDSVRPEIDVPRDACGNPSIDDPRVKPGGSEFPRAAAVGFAGVANDGNFPVVPPGGGGGAMGGGIGGLAGLVGIAQAPGAFDAMIGPGIVVCPSAPSPSAFAAKSASTTSLPIVDARNIQPVDFSQLGSFNFQPTGSASQILISDDFNSASTVEQEAPGSVPAWKVSGTSGGFGFEQAHLFRSQSLVLDTTTIDGDDIFTFAAATNVLSNQFSIKSGAGSDMVVFDKSVRLADLPIGQFDLGTGSNRLRFNGAGNVVDLTAIPAGKLFSIQTLDFGSGGGNIVKLSAAIVQEMVGAGGRLELLTSATDTVDYGAGWKVIGTTVRNNQFFRILEQAGVQIEVAGGHAWQNPLRNLDVNRDGIVSPIDALLGIIELNVSSYSDANRRLFDPTTLTPFPMYFFDVNGDGFISPIDVLLVINQLNLFPGSGESAGQSPTSLKSELRVENDESLWLTAGLATSLTNDDVVRAKSLRGVLRSTDVERPFDRPRWHSPDAKSSAATRVERQRLFEDPIVHELWEATPLESLIDDFAGAKLTAFYDE